ncbi:endonuclease/exonuclease/phosphatase family protein [Rhizohabitans arisaemae]|uniref:endonuclease/exonuclease/phosphatase family protein n=1 Tax=Rhizohabitans arisaemae TaxID=2720610 RepID=UPI0024B1DD24|nr:endonuclease/exonuclease/phosphatase family protein [Rhizohabitans arisaemae]
MLIRVASYNIRSMRDDTAALTRVIRAMRPDVLCLQEAPRFAFWRRKRAGLARRTGLEVAVNRRSGGLAIFTSPRVRLVHGVGRPLRPFAGLERRSIAVAVAEFGGRRIAVGNLHLDLDAAARFHHAVEAVSLLDGLGVPTAIAGDFNEEADGSARRYLARRFTDGDGGTTFPAGCPHKRIDTVFAGPEVRILACGVPAADPSDLAEASDHLPVLAEIELRKPG